jgi:hypothetical protein
VKRALEDVHNKGNPHIDVFIAAIHCYINIYQNISVAKQTVSQKSALCCWKALD